jgi:V-type H+-transporting ATPase subunit a
MAKLIKVCDIFQASRFTIPRREEMQSQINLLQAEIMEKQNFLRQAITSIKDFIRNKVGNEMQASKYELYRLYFKKEKLIFTNLNKCIVQGNFIDGEIWIPEEKLGEIQEGLNNVTKNNESKLTANLSDAVDSGKAAPTYFKLDDLTYPFQEIVSTYGIPRYREINPTLFNIVTFPFLFGVMFGDIGHGLLLSLFGLYLVLRKDDIIKSGSALKPALKARYLLLMMGFFAFYAGWMYNDFISIPLGIFGTCYKNDATTGHALKDPDCVYPFGLDPKWYVASNELAFFNSFKMKFAVIIGVIQMICGIFLKGMNTLHFGNTMDFVLEFIPQFLFMNLLFGYMILMIFVKWATDWGTTDESRGHAPSIITLLLNIFLKGGNAVRI